MEQQNWPSGFFSIDTAAANVQYALKIAAASAAVIVRESHNFPAAALAFSSGGSEQLPFYTHTDLLIPR